MEFINIVFWAAVFIFVIIGFGREFYCWYFKINERANNLDEIVHLLSRKNSAPGQSQEEELSPEEQKLIEGLKNMNKKED
ncbi:MAG: hypothetical protein ACOCP4_07460 [Candidatus Woesearchaeota archaeon]